MGCEIRDGIHKKPDIADFQQVRCINILTAQYEVPYFASVLGISWLCSLGNAATTSLHVELGNNEYFLPPQAASSFSGWDHSLMSSNDNMISLTVFRLNTSNPDASLIKATLVK